MYLRNKAVQLFNGLKGQVIFVVGFIVNELYLTIRNGAIRLLGNPNARVVFIVALVLILALILGTGHDHGGGG